MTTVMLYTLTAHEVEPADGFTAGFVVWLIWLIIWRVVMQVHDARRGATGAAARVRARAQQASRAPHGT